MTKTHLIVFVIALANAVFNTGCDKQATAAEVSATPGTPVFGLNKEAADKAREHFETMWVNRGEFWYGVSGTGGPESMLPRSLIEAKGISFHISSRPLSEADKLNQLEWSGEVNVTAVASRRKPLQPGAAWKDWETGLELYNGDGATTYAVEKRAGQWRIIKPGCEVERPSMKDLGEPSRTEEKDQPAPPANNANPPVTLAGTTWSGHDSTGEFIAYTFEPDGILAYATSKGSWRDGTWKQQGDVVTFEINNSFATYRGQIRGDSIDGTASNENHFSWTWTVSQRPNTAVQKSAEPGVR